MLHMSVEVQALEGLGGSSLVYWCPELLLSAKGTYNFFEGLQEAFSVSAPLTSGTSWVRRGNP